MLATKVEPGIMRMIEGKQRRLGTKRPYGE
jgi:hypothetical protein